MKKGVVLITGTSSGFGMLATVALAKEGYLVIATMRDTTKQNQLIALSESHHTQANIDILKLDVNSDIDIHSAVNYVRERYQTIDILINNAGFCIGGMTEELSINKWREQFETNFFGLVSLTQACLPLMRENKSGKIIHLGSISGRIGFPGLGPYVSSKFALAGFSESLRLELLPFQIKVSLIEAGPFQTKIREKSLENVSQGKLLDYQPLLKTIIHKVQTSASTAAEPNEVIRVILKICQNPKPKFRYHVGKGVRTMVILKQLLPWRIVEWIVKRNLFNDSR